MIFFILLFFNCRSSHSIDFDRHSLWKCLYSLACVRLCAVIIFRFFINTGDWYTIHILCVPCTAHSTQAPVALHADNNQYNKQPTRRYSIYLNIIYIYSLSMKKQNCEQIILYSSMCVFFCKFSSFLILWIPFLFYIFNFYLKYNVYWHNLTFKN